MKPLVIAYSFIRIPKLFVSLLLFPLLIGLGTAICQAMLSGAYLGLITENASDFESRMTSEHSEERWIRRNLFGSEEALPEIQICRWRPSNIGTGESLPTSCTIQTHDIALQVLEPDKYDVSAHRDYFNGATRAIHICKNCTADITLNQATGLANIHGLSALGVYILAEAANSSRVARHFVDAKRENESKEEIAGVKLVHLDGFSRPINLSEASKTMLLILNTCLITITTLWLSLRGHRKVLDYFVRSGALLPLVAACGKDAIYNSLWIITLLRVSLFLLAVLPATILFLRHTAPEETLDLFVGELPLFILWLLGIVASLSSLAVIASIAELKQRHSVASLLYRYIPMLFCVVGTMLWFLFAFVGGESTVLIRDGISILPFFGVSPLLLAPLFPMKSDLIALHSVFASALVLFMLKKNSSWFAAHLEEL